MFWAAWRAVAKPACSGAAPVSRVTCCSCLSRSLSSGQLIAPQNPLSPRPRGIAAEGKSILFGSSRNNDRSKISQCSASAWMELYPPMSESKHYRPINSFFQSTALQLLSAAEHPGRTVSVSENANFPQWQHQWWTIPKLQPQEPEYPPVKITEEDWVIGGGALGGVACSSVIKKRKMKMNRHKYKKRRKKLRFLRRRLGK